MKPTNKKHNLTNTDVVLANLEANDPRLEELFNDSISAGAAFINPGKVDAPQDVAKAMTKDDVTVLATSPESWAGIYNALNQEPGKLNRVKAFLYNGKAEPEERFSLILKALSRGMLNDTYAAYRLAPSAKKVA